MAMTTTRKQNDLRPAMRRNRELQLNIRKEEAIQQRRAQVERENAEWAAQHGIDESELRFLFA